MQRKPIEEISKEFIVANLTDYQIDLIQLRQAMIDDYIILKENKKYTFLDICFIISEKLPATSNNIRKTIQYLRRKIKT
jgi:hypothetical protein